MLKSHVIDKIVLVLLIVGAINWGLVAFADINLVTKLFGMHETLVKLVYGLVAASGLYAISWLVRECK